MYSRGVVLDPVRITLIRHWATISMGKLLWLCLDRCENAFLTYLIINEVCPLSLSIQPSVQQIAHYQYLHHDSPVCEDTLIPIARA